LVINREVITFMIVKKKDTIKILIIIIIIMHIALHIYYEKIVTKIIMTRKDYRKSRKYVQKNDY